MKRISEMTENEIGITTSMEEYMDDMHVLTITNESLDNNIFLSSELLDILESFDKNLNMSIEEYASICKFTGYETNELTLTSFSAESVIEHKQGFLAAISNKLTKLKALMDEDITTIGMIYTKGKGYNLELLKSLKEKLEMGELTAVTEISGGNINSINNQLGVFYAMGYSLSDGRTDDLIEFLKIPIDNILTDKLHESMFAFTDIKDFKSANPLAKDSKSAELLKKLSGITFKVEPTADVFKGGIIIKYLTNKVSLLTVTQSDKIEVHTDVISIDTKKPLAPLSKEEAIKLLTFGIDNSENIKNVFLTIDKFLNGKFSVRVNGWKQDVTNSYTNTTADGIVSLLSNLHRFETNYVSWCRNTIRDTYNYSVLISQIVRASFK